MYTKDKNNRVTLRLNDRQFQFVKANADVLDVSPSEFLRMVVNAAMSVTNGLDIKDAHEIMTCNGRTGDGRENDKTNIDDNV